MVKLINCEIYFKKRKKTMKIVREFDEKPKNTDKYIGREKLLTEELGC